MNSLRTLVTALRHGCHCPLDSQAEAGDLSALHRVGATVGQVLSTLLLSCPPGRFPGPEHPTG